MKLAVGSVVAFAGLGGELYDHPALVESRARWWAKRGAAGIVFYDSLPRFYETPLARFRDVKRALDAAGLPAPVFNALRKSLHLPEFVDADERRLDRCFEVCEILRPSVIDLSICSPLGAPAQPSNTFADDVWRDVASRLKRRAIACRELDAELSIELHDEGLHDNAAGCLRLVDLIDEPNAGVNPDLGNWYRRPDRDEAERWESQLAQLAPKANYWEVKNYRRLSVPGNSGPVCWPTDLDAGDIDSREATEMLWRKGFRGWVCHEGGHADRVTANVRYLSYMRWVLDEWIAETVNVK